MFIKLTDCNAIVSLLKLTRTETEYSHSCSSKRNSVAYWESFTWIEITFTRV